MKKTSIIFGLLCSVLFWPCFVSSQESQTKDTVIEMVTIPSGVFKMGSKRGHGDEKPQHEVHISSFKVSVYEITQAQWQAVMPTNPSKFKGENSPVEKVTWDDVQTYIQKLNAQTGQTFRLLSESEWEYVARAGSEARYSWGQVSIDKGLSNCRNCGSKWANKRTAPVGSFQANSFGVYDMHGNVWEWLQDCWHGDYDDAPSDGRAWLSGACTERVLRGGSWASIARNTGSSFRKSFSPKTRGSSIGIRLAQDL